MAFVDDVRAQLWWSLGRVAVVLAAAWWRYRREGRARVVGGRRSGGGRFGARVAEPRLLVHELRERVQQLGVEPLPSSARSRATASCGGTGGR